MPDNAVTIVAAGAPLREARGVVAMLHGRGATAEDILSLNDELGQDIAYLAPQAPGYSWYPHSFLAPLEQNEPFLSRSLATIAVVLSDWPDGGLHPTELCYSGFRKAVASRSSSLGGRRGTMEA
jgi:hypothetical protein